MKKFNLGLMISSWLELAGTMMLVNFIASYIQVIATHQLSWWNMFNIFYM